MSGRIARPSWRLAACLIGACLIAGPATAQVLLIKHGSDQEAAAYYERISADLGVAIEQSGLTDLVAYLGYRGLSAGDLERIDPADLAPAAADDFMQLVGLVEDPAAFRNNFTLADFADAPILATRFMAPRIVDISGAPPYRAGWRRLVRLDARPDSAAQHAGVASMYIVFSYLRAQDDPAPFPGPDSGDDRMATGVQVVLVPTAGHPTLSDGVYFMLFEGSAGNYASARSVDAPFDLPPDPNNKVGGVFFVPTACGRCHGDVGRIGTSPTFPFGRLNFLNTDYLFDRIRPGDYFAEVGARHGVLFDGGSDQSSDRYAAAFETVRRLNAEIAAQNRQWQDPANTIYDYHLQSVLRWQEVHAESPHYVAPLDRPIGPADKAWDAERPDDGALLALLSRHCYRCHNTIDFNVFNKSRFAGVAKSGISAIMFGLMPVGHDLKAHAPDDAQALIDGLKQLLAQ